MELLDQHINDFIALYQKHHGVVLEREEAVKKGKQLMRFVRLVEFDCSDMNENDYEKYKTQ